MIKSFEDLHDSKDDYSNIDKRNFKKSSSKTTYKWSNEVLRESNSKNSKISSILSWHQKEKEKQKNRLPNEIDFALIRNAFNGVKNSWFYRVKNNRDLFDPIVKNESYDWNKIIELKDE